MARNDKVISELEEIWKGRIVLNLMFCPGIELERLSETMENLSQDIRSPPDLNSGSLRCE
jgi:hypothetical protein